MPHLCLAAPCAQNLRWFFSACVFCTAFAAIGCQRSEDTSLGGPAPVQADDPDAESEVPTMAMDDPLPQPQFEKRKPRRLGDGKSVDHLWDKAADAAAKDPAMPKNPPSLVQFVSPQRLKAAGLRIQKGKHLQLVTDLPPEAAVDELPRVFDLALPKWVAYFGRKMTDWEDWQMTGYLIADAERFRATNLLPADLPAFKNGFTVGNEFWLYDQKTDYYRRHLLLHEGVHGFMFAAYGTDGRPWHLEGMAELLATHLWQDGQLQLPYYPKHKEEVPLLGRIRIVKDEIAARRALRLSQVFQFNSRAHLRNEPYGWCWAAAAFLDGHPRYRERFREACQRHSDAEINRRLEAAMAPDAERLEEEWLIFIAGIEHGHDLERMAVDYATGEVLPKEGRRISVSAERGWQSSRVRLEAGKRYEVAARGRYQIATDEQQRIWWSEPGGVTLRYYLGRPLGILVGAVRPDSLADPASTPFLAPQVIGLQSEVRPQHSGTLYLRVNDSAGELADNVGKLDVFVRELTDS